jgi:Mg-chelatase subunit ChlD
MFCSGDLSQRSHPFSFRTRKLSSVEAMILLWGKVASRQNKVFNISIQNKKALILRAFLLQFQYMDWATKRKLQYFGIIVATIIIFIVIPFYVFIYEAPTCFDGSKNGSEAGIDCGGACKLLCSTQIAEPISRWDPRVFKVSPGTYSVIAYLENPNVTGEVLNAPYSFKLYDKDGILIVEKKGTTFIPKGATFAIFEGGIETGERIPTRAAFSFDGPLVWTRNAATPPQITVVNKALSRLETSPRVDASVTNNSFERIRNIELVAIISDGSGNAIAASRTFIENLERGTTLPIVFTWPAPFETKADVCEAPVDVATVIDRSGSMEFLSKNPPQPLSDVKNAAVYFVNQLGPNDQASIISFANEASVDAGLTQDGGILTSSIDAISIRSGSLQNTNFASGILAATNELLSERARPGAGKVIVALTDGVATHPQKAGDPAYAETVALQAATQAKNYGISLFTIGLGKDLNIPFLQTVASSSAEFYLAPSAKELTTIYKQIATKICSRKPATIEIIPRIYPTSVQPSL